MQAGEIIPAIRNAATKSGAHAGLYGLSYAAL
jgi:hypothetical protein